MTVRILIGWDELGAAAILIPKPISRDIAGMHCAATNDGGVLASLLA